MTTYPRATNDIATTDLAQHVRDISTYDRNEVKALAGAFIETVTPEDLPLVTLHAAKFAEAAKAVQAAGEIRLATTGWEQGREWTDERVGGEVFVFEGDPGDLEVTDPDGLNEALMKAGVPGDMLGRALFKVWKVNNTVLNELAKKRDAWREAIEDFRTRKRPGPPHLRAKEAK